MKITKRQSKIKSKEHHDISLYANYVAIDWASKIMTIARMSSNSNYPTVSKDLPAELKVIKNYLKELRGKTILTIEETTGSHWLYVELRESVERIIICDPYINSLLKEGPKNDKKDAIDLCKLLRTGLLKEVYHSSDKSYQIRKLTSSYLDLIKAIVRQKNQLSAIYRSEGKNYKKEKLPKSEEVLDFIIEEKKETIRKQEEIKNQFHNYPKV